MGSLGLIRLRTLPQGVSFADEHGEGGDSRTPNIALINREEISKYQNVCIIIIIDSQHRLIISELKVSLIRPISLLIDQITLDIIRTFIDNWNANITIYPRNFVLL